MRLLLLMVGFTCCGAMPQGKFHAATVVRVIDGDTVIVDMPFESGARLRLAEVDAPELHQAYGQEAKAALEVLLSSNAVGVTLDERDRYGRWVAWITVDGVSVTHWMIHYGHAWAYRRYLDHTYLLDDEAVARSARKGLWAAENPTPPWDWRASRRK